MITVEDACKETKCNNCGSQDNHKEIRVGDYNNLHHVVFVLCEGCRAELGTEIDRSFN